MKVQVDCCEGNENKGPEGKWYDSCLRDRCPHYRKAAHDVDKNWPWLPTGFGNAFGNPMHDTFLRRVRENLAIKRGPSPSSSA